MVRGWIWGCLECVHVRCTAAASMLQPSGPHTHAHTRARTVVQNPNRTQINNLHPHINSASMPELAPPPTHTQLLSPTTNYQPTPELERKLRPLVCPGSVHTSTQPSTRATQLLHRSTPISARCVLVTRSQRLLQVTPDPSRPVTHLSTNQSHICQPTGHTCTQPTGHTYTNRPFTR